MEYRTLYVNDKLKTTYLFAFFPFLFFPFFFFPPLPPVHVEWGI